MSRKIARWGEHALGRWASAYLVWQLERGFSERSEPMRIANLRYFFRWCEARGLLRPEEITMPILERYQRHMYLSRKSNGAPLSWQSQSNRIRALQGYFRWLVRQGVLVSNPASDLILPRQERRLPRAILTAEEVERVLAVPDVSTPWGLRDRTILEVLYATGVRRLELSRLCVDDVDWERQVLWVREGKGKKDRVLPLGERATSWLLRYTREGREQLACSAEERVLFLNYLGAPLALDPLSLSVREYIEAAGVKKPGACHLFRHTMATLMLEGGADVRFVQEMLGHASLQTTTIYTHVSIRKLQEVHAATHPGVKLQRLSGEGAVVSEPGSAEEAESLVSASVASTRAHE
jgi:integrase/recombinase XerD